MPLPGVESIAWMALNSAFNDSIVTGFGIDSMLAESLRSVTRKSFSSRSM